MEKEQKEIRFSTTVVVKDMFDFLMRHTYVSISGIFGVLLSIGAIVLFLYNYNKQEMFYNVLLLLIAAVFLIIQPIQLWIKAAKQVKLNPMFKEALYYTLNEEGIIVTQKEETLSLKWEEIKKVVESKRNIIIYVTSVSAYILPKNQLQMQLSDIRKILKAYMKRESYKLKE